MVPLPVANNQSLAPMIDQPPAPVPDGHIEVDATHFAFAWALLLVAAPSFAADSGTTDGCTAFTWDVSHELAAMTTPPKQIEASRGSGGEPVWIDIDSHYVVHLAPQTEIHFAAAPGKPAIDATARGGLLTFRVAQAGRYRISLTSNHWIDVVDGPTLLPSRAFQGQHGCERLHKIVEFGLPANRDLILQLSVGTAEEVDVAITAATPL